MGIPKSWIYAIGQGTTNKFIMPDGEFVGDLFFIVDQKNNILHAFAWTGTHWVPECAVFQVEADGTGA